MRRSGMSRWLLAMATVATVALMTAGCSSSKTSDTSSSSTSGAPSETTATAGSTVQVATTSLGQILVDADGRTLYLYEHDTGTTSTCLDSCAQAWPAALVTGTPHAGSGVTATVSTTTRPDGTEQLVVGGHPLYRFSGDAAAGDTNGQGVGSVWYVVSPDGAKVG